MLSEQEMLLESTNGQIGVSRPIVARHDIELHTQKVSLGALFIVKELNTEHFIEFSCGKLVLLIPLGRDCALDNTTFYLLLPNLNLGEYIIGI
jgi:hypothetical protein